MAVTAGGTVVHVGGPVVLGRVDVVHLTFRGRHFAARERAMRVLRDEGPVLLGGERAFRVAVIEHDPIAHPQSPVESKASHATRRIVSGLTLMPRSVSLTPMWSPRWVPTSVKNMTWGRFDPPNWPFRYSSQIITSASARCSAGERRSPSTCAFAYAISIARRTIENPCGSVNVASRRPAPSNKSDKNSSDVSQFCPSPLSGS